MVTKVRLTPIWSTAPARSTRSTQAERSPGNFRHKELVTLVCGHPNPTDRRKAPGFGWGPFSLPPQKLIAMRTWLTARHGLVYGCRMHEWTITYLDGTEMTTTRITADGWQIAPSGDLAFLNEPWGARPFYLRAFAKGVWLSVSHFG